MRLFKMGAILACAALCLANNGSCTGGGVNSASAHVADACASAAAVAQRVDQAAPAAEAALLAIGVPQAKVDQIVAGIRKGELAITATCAIVQTVITAAPPPGGAAAGGDAPVQPVT